METNQIRIRLQKEDLETLDELCIGAFSRQQVASMLLAAAVHAVRENAGSLSFPPKFTVGVHEHRASYLSEPAPKRK